MGNNSVEAQAPPELYLEHPSSTENLLAISLDPDAPFPSFSFLGPILHWVQPDLTPTPSDSDSSITTLNSASPQIMDYAPPGPPPGSSPHKYVFLLFKQPPGFDSKKYVPKGQQEMGIKARIRTDVEKWVAEKGLGPVVAANYFTSN
jgi:phosphatidylethanolamine-binding protein (PEBP) family uncharacterized protein